LAAQLNADADSIPPDPDADPDTADSNRPYNQRELTERIRGGTMKHLALPRTLLLLIVAVVLLSLPVAAQHATSDESAWSPPRTSHGQPNLQGMWTNNTATAFERPKAFGDKAYLSDEDLADLQARLDKLREETQAGDLLADFLIQKVLEDPEFRGFDQDTGNYNSFWLAKRELDHRTSLVIDPPDGRLPAMTPEAMKRLAAAFRGYSSASPAGPEDLTLSVRCISYGVPNTLAGYNSFFQILQTADHVVILQELIHDARVIPLVDRPRLGDGIRLWHGDSRGHFEGDVLVVETRNYSAAGSYRGASENIRVVERFTRVAAGVLEWEITFDDPSTWESPWTMMIPLERSEDSIFEYACHEGNYGLEGILAGARAQEKTAQAAAADAG